MIRNKARLVAQGYAQEEGIYYDKVFAPVARIKAIRVFLAYASFKDFVVYQMDVKSDFLYEKIEEKVYVCQPPGFEDPDFPDRVYKVEKVLYGLHQAPGVLSTYLLDNGFQRGKINKTLFIKRHKGDILLVQVYVDDIIFVKQKKDGIFISQDKYVAEILKKFRFTEVKTASIHMETQKPLLKDEDGEEVDVYMYRSMIGSLMYLTSSRPDIMFAVCSCARYQVNPKVSHLHDVKRIFSARNRQWLQIPQQKLNMWLLQVAVDKCFGFKINYLIMDFLNAHPIRYALTINPTIYISCIKQFWSTAMTKTINEEVQIHARVDGKEIVITESSVRRDLQLAYKEVSKSKGNEFSSTMASAVICLATNQKFNFLKLIFDSMIRNLDNVTDEAVHKELGDRLVRVATTSSSLEAEQDSSNRTKTQSKEKPNEPSFQGTDSSGGPRCQETMWDTTSQTRVESSRDEEILGEDASKQGRRIDAIASDDDITLVNDDDNEMFDVDMLGGEEMFVPGQDKNVVEEVVDAAQVKGIVFQDSCKSTTTITISSQQSQDKGKRIMIEEPVKPKKKDQIRLNEKVALKLQAKFNEEEKLASEKAEK
nr:copia protein [Tanacetum cinerariifolium]